MFLEDRMQIRDKAIYDAIEQGILICDEEARIAYCNDSYADFIGVPRSEAIGKKLVELRPGAVAPKVLETGEKIVSALRKERGRDYFADIYPIMEDGRVVGTVSVVTEVEMVSYLKERMEQLNREEEALKVRLNLTNGTRYSFSSIVGSSRRLLDTMTLAKRVAKHDTNILLQGESGTGKELFAQSIHNESSRRAGPFVAINCAALSKTMLESEMFGYEEGAFTGARKGGKPGLFETAKGGTLFLDEISEMDMELQAKLLRVLQENRFRRIGGTKEIETDVRIISACNVDLMKYIDEKKFRRDLFYRIAVVPISVPALRERMEDIPILCYHFVKRAEERNKREYSFSDEVIDAFRRYSWPGNIRELRNCVEYAAMMSNDGCIDVSCLPRQMYSEDDQDYPVKELSELVREFERNEIQRALDQFGHDTKGKKAAAGALGISLSSLYSKLAAEK
ncbi:MAG: sigma 54-interacting transcriptional regulator [Lachnospiraceae bacterium]|nr:sigma 54-interacting transcriptional regulator [Lachnospiraceae bacterium]